MIDLTYRPKSSMGLYRRGPETFKLGYVGRYVYMQAGRAFGKRCVNRGWTEVGVGGRRLLRIEVSAMPIPTRGRGGGVEQELVKFCGRKRKGRRKGRPRTGKSKRKSSLGSHSQLRELYL